MRQEKKDGETKTRNEQGGRERGIRKGHPPGDRKLEPRPSPLAACFFCKCSFIGVQPGLPVRTSPAAAAVLRPQE